MQVRGRWLKLALVAVALMHAVADAQVYTMESDLDGSDTDSGSDLTVVRTPTPTAKRPTRTWIPITDAPSDSSETTDTPAATPRVKRTPRPTTKTPRTTEPPATSDSETSSNDQETPTTEESSDGSETTRKTKKPTTKKSSDSESTTESELDSTGESGSEEAVESTDASGASTPTTKKKKSIFTRSPYLKQTTPVPNGIPTADDESSSEESASTTESETDSNADSNAESNSEDSGSASKTTKPKTTKTPKTKKKASDSASGSDSSAATGKKTSKSKSSNATKESSDTGASGTDQTDKADQTESATTPSPNSSKSSFSSASTSASGSSSAASVMTDSASSGKPSTNTLMLGLMMGGAVALVMLVAVFVYIKTSNKDEEDDDMDPVLRTARHDASKGTTAQTSTLNANYHDNNNMSPMQYSDDDYYPNHHQPHHSGQYDQDPYGHHNQSHGQQQYNDDYLTPQSQIALAQTNMSLPPMAQTGNSHADSQYSQYSAESSFYANSTYSANPSTVSQVVNKYPGMRQGGENDVAGSEEEESDFEGDSIHDMANTQNEWNTAGRRGTAASGMDQSTVGGDSRFHPSDTRSTAASGYHGGNSQFAESEYTEYRMSTGYENSYVNGGHSGYDQSFAASQSGYDQSYAGHKSFQSSGFSEYETAAPPRGRGDSTNSDASSFYRTKESSYY